MPQKPATRLDHGARIGRAMALLVRDPDDAPDLEVLAAAAAFSPCHFHRIYRHLTGETPADTLARRLLRPAGVPARRGARPAARVHRRDGGRMAPAR